MCKSLKVLAIAVGVAMCAAACSSSATRGPSNYHQKLVVLGFDGMDPHLLKQWMDAGRMPNFSALAKQGGFYPLGTTHSPESPTAWASFATGVNAGKHNIYDFLVRDTTTYLPDLGMVTRAPPTFLFNYFPISKPRVESIRGGTSFWVTAGKAGVRSDVLTVPVTFPPEHIDNGEELSGLPLPDVRGTMGTFSYYATDLSRYEEGNTEMGGILKRLVFEGDTANTELDGPPSPIVRTKIEEIRRKPNLSESDRAQLAELQADADVRVPFTIQWDRASKGATIDIEGQAIHLNQGKWTKWIHLTFEINYLVRVHGMMQMLLENAGSELQLYVSPVNFEPQNPPVPMSYPDSLSADLYKELGDYRTLGWAEATWPLNENRMDEKTFMDDLFVAFNDRARVILNRIDKKDWDLMVGVIESTDRASHMMWRLIDPKSPMYDASLAAKYGDSIEKVYERADQFVGEVRQHVGPEVPIVIVSDHGFHSWRKSVNLDTWLVDNGYMMLKGQEQASNKKLADLFGGGTFWENVDWSHTRAYAMGLGQIYFNVRGREAQGIVSPGAESAALENELVAKLLTMKDPEDGSPIINAVYKREDIYSGPYFGNAAELQVGMNDGYRVSWQTALGGSPPGLVYTNDRKWSGDHGGYDYKLTSGIIVSSSPINTTTPSIMDIAPTVLKYFGVGIPADIDGKPLF
ncbi:MAG TPA: alkaline phosphatase family protein [Vicinamibacterales bacterium]